MSGKKHSDVSLSDAVHIFARIEELLIQTKAALCDSNASEARPLDAHLHELVELSEQFLVKRSKADKEWLARALDTLDREGTNLWNIAGSISPSENPESSLPSALRLTGFRLIEAGLPSRPDTDGLIHVLRLASKTGSILAETGQADVATSVLSSAAKYEEKLRNIEIVEDDEAYSRTHATVVYYYCRMDAAWQEGNDSLAEYMLQTITVNNNERLINLPAIDRQMIVSKVLEIGKTLLAFDNDRHGKKIDQRAPEAVSWIQKACTLTDLLDESAAGALELKRSVTRNMARAYALSAKSDTDYLERAEASLKELLDSSNPNANLNTDEVNSEYQELRWWLLAVLRKRDASYDDLLGAFKEIIDHIVVSDENVTRIIQELKILPRRHQDLGVSVLRLWVSRCREQPDTAPSSCVDQIVLALIFQCQKSQDHAQALRDLRDSLDNFHKSGVHISKTGATACLMLFWQCAHQHFRAGRHSEAAEWYLLGTHSVFECISAIASDKCCRKAALCYIEFQDYTRATVSAQQCSPESALTQYILLLIAIRQGIENEAVRATKAMVEASDFDKRMLLMATKLAHEADLKTLLLSVLEELLRSTLRDSGLRVGPETTALVRCTIRMVIRLMADPATMDKNVFVDTLIRHFKTASEIVKLAHAQEQSPLVVKDISWLWRTAYNCANQGCIEWENSEEKAPPLFEVAGELIEIYCQSVVQVEEEVHMAAVLSSFAATSAKVFTARRRVRDPTRIQIVSNTVEIAHTCERVIRTVLEKAALQEHNATIILRCLRAVLVFQVELTIVAKDWSSIPAIIDSILGLPTDLMDTLEAVTDMLWAERECPLSVLLSALENILHASLDRQTLSVAKFSRWLRAICVMLLSRNTTPERLRAIAYIEQAVSVLSDHSEERDENGEIYPLDERLWLLTTTYNAGIECLHTGLLEEAKRWFEASTMFCRFVPDGEARARKISDTYASLLSRYSG